MSSTAIKEVIEPHCVYKSAPTGRAAVMGVELITNEALPIDWALLTFQSGKKVLLRLIDGKTVELPNLGLPELLEFPDGERFQYGRL